MFFTSSMKSVMTVTTAQHPHGRQDRSTAGEGATSVSPGAGPGGAHRFWRVPRQAGVAAPEMCPHPLMEAEGRSPLP